MSGCCTPVIVPAGGGGGGGEPGKTTGVVTLVDDNGPFLRHIVYGVNGVPESATDTDLSGVTGYSPTGAVAPYPPPQRHIVEQCACDDTDGDGIPDTDYLEVWAVDPTGAQEPTRIGTYRDGDLAQPYTPVSPVPCWPTAESG